MSYERNVLPMAAVYLFFDRCLYLFPTDSEGCQTSGQRKFTAKDLAPLRGATQLISRIPGGLRGLRPPATFFATLRVAEVCQLYRYPFNGAFETKPSFIPGVNAWATES